MKYDLGRVDVRKRNGLPHWDAQYGIYFITFNLFDAIPMQVRLRICQEANERLKRLEVRGDPTMTEKRAIDEWAHAMLGESLDGAYGSCFMRDERIARIVADAVTYFDEERYRLLAWCVMPNHVHVVMDGVIRIDGVIRSWKSFSAKRANALLGRKGDFWQVDYFDRCIRDSRHLWNTIEYVARNPAKAGLVEWPFVRVYSDRLR